MKNPYLHEPWKMRVLPYAPHTFAVEFENEKSEPRPLVAALTVPSAMPRADARRIAEAVALVPDLLRVLRRMMNAATSRESIMGDPCALLAAKDEVHQAAKEALALICKIEGIETEPPLADDYDSIQKKRVRERAEFLSILGKISDEAGFLDPLAAPPARINYDTIMRVRDIIAKFGGKR